MAGLPGTGKTTLARALALRIRGRVIGKDEIRHALFLPGEIEYSSRQDDFCLQIMLATAGYFLNHNRERVIFLDGRTFSRRYQVNNVIEAAVSLHQNWRVLECICTEETARQRLAAQATQEHLAANRDFKLYQGVRSRFEEIRLQKTVINTDDPLAACIEQALAALR
jgi:predicted kinase